MVKNKNIIAIIPARGGSRGVPKKNIIDLGGYPLISYSIACAKLSKHISRVIVSTDSQEIADIAKKYGAEVPFMRPAEFATDTAVDIDVIKHAMGWLRENENFEPEYIVFLRPVTPLREPELIDKAIEYLHACPEATSLRSGWETREAPHKLFGKDGKFFTGLFPSDPRPEYYNLPRQAFAPVYQPDGYVDIWKTKTIKETGILHGDKILAFESPNSGELDTIKDLEFIKFNLQNNHYSIYDYLKEHFKND